MLEMVFSPYYIEIQLRRSWLWFTGSGSWYFTLAFLGPLVVLYAWVVDRCWFCWVACAWVVGRVCFLPAFPVMGVIFNSFLVCLGSCWLALGIIWLIRCFLFRAVAPLLMF